MQINKLGALFLFTSQGAVMLIQGQEYAHSKVIAPTLVPDHHVGRIDHNSYNKDNETNWVNYQHVELNKDLVDYHRGLIELRKKHPALRRSDPKAITFFECENSFAFAYLLPGKIPGDSCDILVLLNAHPHDAAQFDLPRGEWQVLVDDTVDVNGGRVIPQQKISIPSASGMMLCRAL